MTGLIRARFTAISFSSFAERPACMWHSALLVAGLVAGVALIAAGVHKEIAKQQAPASNPATLEAPPPLMRQPAFNALQGNALQAAQRESIKDGTTRAA